MARVARQKRLIEAFEAYMEPEPDHVFAAMRSLACGQK